MLDVMVEGVTVGNALQRHVGAPADDAGALRLYIAVEPVVLRFQLVDEGIDHQLGGVEHGRFSSDAG